MKELEFMEKINDLDPELLEDGPAAGKRSRSKLIRRFVIAAAAVLLLAGTAYGVAKGIELRKTDNPETDEQGFEAKAELPLVPWSSFKGEVQEAGAQIVAQHENYVPQPMYSSYYEDPGLYSRQFDSLDEAAAYLGLEGLRTPTFPFEEYDCSVSAYGDETGEVSEVRINAQHIEPGRMNATETVTILTDAAQNAAFTSGGVWTYEFPRDVEFRHYTTPGGNDCAIAVLWPEYEVDGMGVGGYVAAGSAFYELWLGAVPREEVDAAIQTLHDWADALDK